MSDIQSLNIPAAVLAERLRRRIAKVKRGVQATKEYESDPLIRKLYRDLVELSVTCTQIIVNYGEESGNKSNPLTP